MDDAEVARLLRGLHAKPPVGRDEQEVAGYADLLGRVFDNYKTIKLTEGQIYDLLDRAMPEVSIRQALSRLITLHLIERIGAGRGIRYKRTNPQG